MKRVALYFSLICIFTSWMPLLAAPDSPRALIVIGPSRHPPGTHEVAAGARLMAFCLESLENAQKLEVDVVDSWTSDWKTLKTYDTVVLIGDSFPGERMAESDTAMKDLARMMKKGCGMITVHYGVGLKNEDMGPDGDHPLLHWTGGYFAAKCDHHQSVAKIYEAATIVPADPAHPIANGVMPFTIKDEPYIKNYFGPKGRMLPGAFPVATSMLPPDDPNKEIIAWGIERPDSGRGLGITLPHFFQNWKVEPLRKFIINGILWTAKVEVPNAGAKTTLPDLQHFEPESVVPVPRKK
ncbi:MAG: ThuA domain-containing protein [Puniceicoccaceae bacterium]